MLQQLKPRHIKLLRLLSDQNDFQPASYFGEILNVSTKTILNDLEIMNQCLKGTDVSIIKMPQRGISLEGKVANLDDIYRESLELNESFDQKEYPVLRQLEIVRQVLIEGKKLHVFDIEQIFYVSSTSVRSDVDTLNQVFNVFNVNVTITRQVISFAGIESDIQKALKHFILDFVISDEFEAVFLDYDPLQRVMNQLFEENFVALVDREVNHLVENVEKVISNWFIRSLHLTILIQFVRILNGHHMTEEDVRFKTISHLEPYMLTIELIERYERDFGLVFCEADIYYLSQQMYAHGIEPTLRTTKLHERYENTVIAMIQTMSYHLRVDLNKDDKLKNSLLSHLPPMIYRLRRNVAVKNPLLEEIKNQYIVLFSLTWYVAIGLEQMFDVDLTDDEISFLFIYFQVSLERRYQYQFKNVIIVCPYGLATSELVFARVRQIIPYIDNITTMTTHQLYQTDLSKVDYIISTVKLDEVKPPVIYVSPLMDEQDMGKILKFNSDITTKVNRLESCDEDWVLSLDDLIDPDLVFNSDNAKTKEEALDKMIDAFEKSGYVTEMFGRKVYDREKMGDTSLYTGVALPHAFPETVNASKIGIMTLNEEIRWGSNHVNVIMLIALSESDTGRIKQVLSRLLTVLESTEFITSLRNAESKEEIICKMKQRL